MAFPATYNFTYYRGNTYKFQLFPKNSDGSAMSLVDSNDDPFTAIFAISTNRIIESPSDAISGATTLDTGESSILATITPTVGKTLVPGTPYFYDVSVKNEVNGEIYTIVTGTITVVGNVEDL